MRVALIIASFCVSILTTLGCDAESSQELDCASGLEGCECQSVCDCYLGLACVSGLCVEDGDTDKDTCFDEETTTDTDTDTDADTESDSESDLDSETCIDECLAGLWTECTCDLSDPCGWSNDGICDGYCVEAGLAETSYDTTDCSGPCSGMCDYIQILYDYAYTPEDGLPYVVCVCGVDDPCDWASNGICEEAVCIESVTGYEPLVPPEEMFDDSADCGGADDEDDEVDGGEDGLDGDYWEDGYCGDAEANQASSLDCKEIGPVGCCDENGNRLWCGEHSSGTALWCEPCAENGGICGWISDDSTYGCGSVEQEGFIPTGDPSGEYPMYCAESTGK